MSDKNESPQTIEVRTLQLSESRKSFDTIIAVKPSVSAQSLQALITPPAQQQASSAKK